MSPQVESHLALLLFLPWFLILGTLFWVYPRQPRDAARRAFDIATLASAVVGFVVAVEWATANADPGFGRMWKQVFATSVGYGAFLAVLGAGFWLRRSWLVRRSARGSQHGG